MKRIIYTNYNERFWDNRVVFGGWSDFYEIALRNGAIIHRLPSSKKDYPTTQKEKIANMSHIKISRRALFTGELLLKGSKSILHIECRSHRFNDAVNSLAVINDIVSLVKQQKFKS